MKAGNEPRSATNEAVAVVVVVAVVVGALTSSNMLVYLRDGSAQTSICAATLRWKLQIKLSISPSHSILTSGK